MPRIVVVQAVAPFEYDGQHVRAGERVAMAALDAVAHHRAGHVSLTRWARAVLPADIGTPRAAAVEPPATPAARRRYRRRDLQPEP